MSVTIELPWPPTVNTYYRAVPGFGMKISDAGRRYARIVRQRLTEAQVRPFSDFDRLVVTIDAYPPDRRRRDLDNCLKAMVDALQHGGLYPDDSKIDRILIQRRERRPPLGLMVVTVATPGVVPPGEEGGDE